MIYYVEEVINATPHEVANIYYIGDSLTHARMVLDEVAPHLVDDSYVEISQSEDEGHTRSIVQRINYGPVE